MAPLVREADSYAGRFAVDVCVTAQHRAMLDQVLDFFGIVPRCDLDLMRADQTLFDITARGLVGFRDVLESSSPDLVVVQGDTTTTLVGALWGFYGRVHVAHLEAGLRSGSKTSPYPEEMNRVLTSRLADYHFAPTLSAVENLAREGVTENVWMVGNTGIDALFHGLALLEPMEEKMRSRYRFLAPGKKLVLVTGHRRESFGKPFEGVCRALKELAAGFEDIEIVYPVHLNPEVKKPVYKILSGRKRIHLTEPMPYPDMLWLLKRSFLVLTDSGGIQEEAPSLGKPVLVLREVTERTEGVKAGTARLVGTDTGRIVEEASLLLTDESAYSRMANTVNPYGDGKSAKRIFEILSGLDIGH